MSNDEEVWTNPPAHKQVLKTASGAKAVYQGGALWSVDHGDGRFDGNIPKGHFVHAYGPFTDWSEKEDIDAGE